MYIRKNVYRQIHTGMDKRGQMDVALFSNRVISLSNIHANFRPRDVIFTHSGALYTPMLDSAVTLVKTKKVYGLTKSYTALFLKPKGNII